MLRISLGLLAGQFAVFSIPSVPIGLGVLFGITFFIVFYWLPRWRITSLAVIFGGVIAALAVYQHKLHQWPAEFTKTDVLVSGIVDGLPNKTGSVLKLFLRDIRLENENMPKHVLPPRRIRLSWFGPTKQPRAGERWQFVVRLKKPAGLGNLGSFDAQRHSFITHVDAVGYVRDKAKLLQKAPRLSVSRVRHAISDKISASSNGHTVPLVLGLALGVSSGMSDDQWQVLRQTGTVHLLAISGLHIGLIAALGYFLASVLWSLTTQFLNRFESPCNKLTFALPMSFCFAATYAALAGFSLPTQRALIMLGVAAVGLLARRVAVANFALCAAAIFIAVFDPTAVLSIGFVMSFAAVALLIFLAQGRQATQSKWLGAIRLQWQLSLLLLPLSAWFFSSGSLISPLANLIAVPIVGFVLVPLSILTALLAFTMPSVSALTLQVAETGLSLLMAGLQLLADTPGSHIALPISQLTILVLALIALAATVAPMGLRLRRWAGVLLVAPLLYWLQLPKVAQLEVHVLDVGQGLAVAVFTQQHTLLFDTGGRFGNVTMMERVVQPFLARHRRTHIDTLVISHADEDHSAGMEYVLDTQPHVQVFASDSDKGQFCQAGTTC